MRASSSPDESVVAPGPALYREAKGERLSGRPA